MSKHGLHMIKKSSPKRADVINAWNYIFISAYVFMTRCYRKRNKTVSFDFTDFYGVKNFPFLSNN
jgi:hypothetical protein